MRGNSSRNSGDDSGRFCLKSSSGASLLLELRGWRLIQWGFTSSLEVVHGNNAPAVRMGFPQGFVRDFCLLLYRGVFQSSQPYGTNINRTPLTGAQSFQMLGMALGILRSEGKMKCMRYSLATGLAEASGKQWEDHRHNSNSEMSRGWCLGCCR